MSTDVIKPYAGGDVASRAPAATKIATEVGTIEMTAEAQRASTAAAEFSSAFPQITEAITKKGVNNLDPASQQNLNEFYARMQANPPKPATIINLLPWQLEFGYGNPLLRGFKVPACEPSQKFNYAYIRGWRKDKKADENGAWLFTEFTPIQIAGEFMREYMNSQNDGCGVLIYEGEIHPDKAGQVAIFDQLGRMKTVPVKSFTEDEEGNKVPIIGQTPVTENFQKLLLEAIKVRNQTFLRKVRQADHDYNLPDGRGKKNVNERHILMAEVLFAEGIITERPKWDLTTRATEGFEDDNCKSCGIPRRANAYKCGNCNHILDPFEAYMDGAIEYGHASMDKMTSDEWVMVEAEKDRRSKEKAEAKRLAKERREALKETTDPAV